MRIVIKSDLDKMAKGLERQQSNVLRAIVQGLQAGGNKVRTKTHHAMQDQTSLLKYSSVTSRSRTINPYVTGLAPKSGIGPPRGRSLSYTIVYKGKPATKASEFKTSVATGPGGGVTAIMWRRAIKFARSFLGKGRAAGGLLSRRGDPHNPIAKLMGPNLAEEAVKDQVAETFVVGVQTIVVPEIEKRLAKAL